MQKKTALLFILAAFWLMTVSCKADQPSRKADAPRPSEQAVPPSGGAYQLGLYPKEATRRTVLRISASGFDAATARIEWFVDGTPAAAPVPTEFPCVGVPKGSKVQAKAVMAGQEVWSNTIVVLNTPPELTYVKLLPEIFQPGDVLTTEARAEDIDGDAVTIRYSWQRNGAPAGNTDRLAVQPRRGDKITSSVTPFDGESYGGTLTIDREISNLPPFFVEHQNASLQENRYLYQAQASDPDGDILTYSLQSPSEGVSVNQATGELIWVVPNGFTREKTVTIVADDGHDGRAQYTLTFTIRE